MFKKQKLYSTRTRLLTTILSILISVIIIIALVFNILVNNYISNTSISQLAEATKYIPDGSKVDHKDNNLPDLSKMPRGRIGTKAQVFKISESYTVFIHREMSDGDNQIAQAIADSLESKHIKLGQINNLRLSTNSGDFYISSVVNPWDSLEYMIFYVDITGIQNFADSINLYLFIIMAIMIMISILIVLAITRRMTQPLTDLTAFSQQIGRGDFTPFNKKVHDRELSTLAASMNHTASQLDKYDKEQKLFFQNASHELRTPLMSIKCYAEGINYGIMDAASASSTILAETDRLSEMVDDLLTISRIDNITKDSFPEECDLRELLATSVEEQRSIAEKRKISFLFDFDTSPVLFIGNEKTLSCAFSNLISNALRYAKSEIKLICKQDQKKIFITVQDDGSGISEEDLPHIFERFYKGQNGNHGIGLSIVKAVSEQHGGNIRVESNVTGTSVMLSFERNSDTNANTEDVLPM
jgi:Signal transduction histidine kinase